jgi:hypothetical protein
VHIPIKGVFGILEFNGDVLSREIGQAVREGEVNLWVYGYIRYRDGIRNDERVEGFCFSYLPGGEDDGWMNLEGPEAYRFET